MQDGVVQVRLIGSLAVTGDLASPVPSGRASRLLAILADRQGEFVQTTTLADHLWPHQTPSDPLRNVASLVSRLRRSLGRERIDGGPRAYRLVQDRRTTVDLVEAANLTTLAERELAHGHSGPALRNTGHAVRLLDGGPALADEPDSDWSDGVRDAAEALLDRARRCRWAAALQAGDLEIALEETGRTLAANPLDEEAARAAMRAHVSRGSPADAIAVYERLRAALATQLGLDPSASSHQVHLEILRGTPAPEHDAGTHRNIPGTAGPVGRDHEIATLARLWDDAVRGHGRIALLRGERGIGKSTLCAAAARRAEQAGGVAVVVRCAEAERSLYLQPLADIVRGLLAHHLPGAADLLGDADRRALTVLVPELDEWASAPDISEMQHRRTVDALAHFLGRVAEQQPLLVGIEDIENAGQSSIDALHYLTDRLAENAVLTVATENAGEYPHQTVGLEDVAVVLDVGPLDRAAVGTLLDDAGSRHDLDRFFAWTGGSPLLVSELLRHPAPEHPERDGPDIPATLHDALIRRLAATTDDVRDVLAQASVLGRSFGLDDLAALTAQPVEVCAQRCERAQRSGLVGAHGDEFRFASEILRRIVYDESPRPVRISRHRRAAALLADRPEAAAGHLAAAGDHRESARAWLQAADAAHLVFAHAESERMLTRAVEQAGPAGDPILAAQAMLRRGSVRCDLARYDDARDDHERALGTARDHGDEELETAALEALGWTALHARDALATVDLAEQAGYLAESAAAAPGARRSSVLLLGRVRHWDGDYSGAAAAYDEVLASDADDVLAATATAYRGALLQHTDRFDEARVALLRAVRLCTRTGEFRTLLQSLFFCALARGDSGDFAGALRSLDRARRLIDEAGVNYYRAGIETTTSWLWQELGRVDLAREHAELAVDLARRGGGALELEQALHALLALADCELLEGRDDDAGSRVEEAATLLELSLPFRQRAEMRLLEMQARWRPELSEQLLEHARRFRSAKYEALALAHLGRAAEASAAARRTSSALVIASVCPGPERDSALERIRAGLPPELRDDFTRRGRLLLPRPVLH
ncbi:ATP-binding protein [Pseudonocardia parietis]|uniref:DNA-binding SARP family transcriptional activator n=1 Tax=Pseudonocardia parietis TaxID=570936 RepID=A0ABS4VV81_9PSEU|nr:AAA family ATPase [Pseudonocardia parietis]MBP2367842.1 DNA-binding SARP family transcriptional activator [Pseudonocardia parietis]